MMSGIHPQWFKLVLVISLLLAGVAKAGEVGADVVRLPALSKKSAWSYEGSELAIDEVGEYLAIDLKNLPPQTKVMIKLNQPIPVPEGMELCFSAALSQLYELFFLPVVRDANGSEFSFEPTSLASVKNGCFVGGCFYKNGLNRLGEVLARTEGMRSFIKGSYARVDNSFAQPKAPFTLIGVQVSTKRKQANAMKSVFYVRDFLLTNLTHKNCGFYYQFQGQERFVELDGEPSFRFSDFSMFAGERFVVDWDVRDQYAGQPILAGAAEYSARPDSPYPIELQLSREQVKIAVTAPGVYWVRAKLRAYAKSTDIPVKILEREFRLYVINGKESVTRSAEVPQRIGSGMIRIAPQQSSLIWEDGTPFKFAVHFFDAVNKTCHVEVVDSVGTLVAKAEQVATTTSEVITIDMKDASPGLYTVKATVLNDGRPLDAETRLLGRKSPNKEIAPFEFPAGIATASEIKNGPALFQLDFHMEQDAKYAETIKHAIPYLLPITKHFEFRCDWAQSEQYPGVYDFRALDDMLAFANEKGAKIQLFFSIQVPEWAPSHYTQNAEGGIFGHEAYLFHGARLNIYQSPLLRPAYLEFIRNVVLHYRSNPAVEGYYLLIEHPGEAPYKGWFEGFDPYTIANFRQAMRGKYKSIEALNQAWRTEWKDFDSLRPVKHGEQAASQFWSDWITFREDAVDRFREDVIATIRKYDPKRLIMVYGSGDERYSKYNVMTANGGCRRPAQFGYDMMRVADLDQGQRAEEVSCTNWYAFYPTHLDTSLFSMMMGGGKNAFCKMFFPVRLLPENGDLTKIRKNNGLERYEKFIPIWQELRNTDVVFKDIRLYTNEDAFRAERKSTFHPGGSSWDGACFLGGQIPFWVAPGSDWLQSKIVVAFPERLRYLSRDNMAELGAYVKNGGVLIMGANTGKTRIDDDAQYAFLQEFGFRTPGEDVPGVPFPIFSASDKVKIGLLRYFLPHELVPGEDVFALNAKDQPVITSRAYGKGRVYVLWAGTNVPPSDKYGMDIQRSYLRDIALMHGAKIPTSADSVFIWTNLLKEKQSKNWYLLVMRDENEKNGTAPQTILKVNLPAGNYQITELINNKINLRKSSTDLATSGLQITLAEKEVAILKLAYEP